MNEDDTPVGVSGGSERAGAARPGGDSPTIFLQLLVLFGATLVAQLIGLAFGWSPGFWAIGRPAQAWPGPSS